MPPKLPPPTTVNSVAHFAGASVVHSEAVVNSWPPYVQEDILLGFQAFARQFPNFVTDQATQMLGGVNGETKHLAVSRVKTHQLVYAPLWLEECVTRGASFAELLEFLNPVISLHSRIEYAPRYQTVADRFSRIFGVFDYTNPERVEANLMSRFEGALASFEINDKQIWKVERCPAAAAGVVAKQLHRSGKVDSDAGILGYTDLVLRFGHPSYGGKVFAVIEGKIVPSGFQGNWVEVDKALVAQMWQSLVGHDAMIAVAVTNVGIKVIFKQVLTSEIVDDVRHDRVQFRIWPTGPTFHSPPQTPLVTNNVIEIDHGVIFMSELVRIATVEQQTNENPRYARMSIPHGVFSPADPKNSDIIHIAYTPNGQTVELRSIALGTRFSPEQVMNLQSTIE